MDKKKLLKEAESMVSFTQRKQYSNFFDNILNLIEIAENSSEDETERKQKFLKLLSLLKDDKNISILGGGKQVKQGLKDFIENHIMVRKYSDYQIANPRLQNLSLTELKYVFGWARRLAGK